MLALASALRPTVPLAVSAGLNLVYVVGVVALVRALGGRADRPASALVLAGAGIFALAGLTGEPTAREPGIMLLNAAVLAAVAVTLMIAGTGLALRCATGPARTPAALGMLALVIGSGGYLVNLLARWAVVLSGAAELQAAVEDSSWVAYAYLPGLDTEPTFLGYLLVLFDLLQLTYVVLTYLGFGALASALGRAGFLPARRGPAHRSGGGGPGRRGHGGRAPRRVRRADARHRRGLDRVRPHHPVHDHPAARCPRARAAAHAPPIGRRARGNRSRTASGSIMSG